VTGFGLLDARADGFFGGNVSSYCEKARCGGEVGDREEIVGCDFATLVWSKLEIISFT
jgi:hypothetical protein